MGCFIFSRTVQNYSTSRSKNKFLFKYTVYIRLYSNDAISVNKIIEQNYGTPGKINHITQLIETRIKEQKFISEFNENRIHHGIRSNYYRNARVLKVCSYSSHLRRYVKLLLASRFSHWLMVPSRNNRSTTFLHSQSVISSEDVPCLLPVAAICQQ